MITTEEYGYEDACRLEHYRGFIDSRRQNGNPAKQFSPNSVNACELAAMITAGGIVAMPYGSERRRIMILTGSYDDYEAMDRLNDIKGRPARQVLGIGCLPETVHQVAKIEESRPLVDAARRVLNVREPGIKDLTRVLESIYDQNSVGLMFKAKDLLPDRVTAPIEGGRSVLILGATDFKDPYDIYNMTLWELIARYGKVLGGTSANFHGKNAYSVTDQEQLYVDMKFQLDAVVMFDEIPSRSPKPRTGASSTTFDLTGEKAGIHRWGSQHPENFRRFFPNMEPLDDMKKEKYAESIFSYMKSSLAERLHLPF